MKERAIIFFEIAKILFLLVYVSESYCPPPPYYPYGGGGGGGGGGVGVSGGGRRYPLLRPPGPPPPLTPRQKPDKGLCPLPFPFNPPYEQLKR